MEFIRLSGYIGFCNGILFEQELIIWDLKCIPIEKVYSIWDSDV